MVAYVTAIKIELFWGNKFPWCMSLQNQVLLLQDLQGCCQFDLQTLAHKHIVHLPWDMHRMNSQPCPPPCQIGPYLLDKWVCWADSKMPTILQCIPMQYITCFTFSALMISTFMKRLAAAVVASHITITAGLHVYGKRKRLQEDDDYEESKVKGQGYVYVCACIRVWMSVALHWHQQLLLIPTFILKWRLLVHLTSGICGGAGSLPLSQSPTGLISGHTRLWNIVRSWKGKNSLDVSAKYAFIRL